MLPEFPEFKKLDLEDREEIEKITRRFPPYSDFNFVSMWSWNIKDDMMVSLLHGNLVVRFTDYLTGNPFFSFLGDNKINETTDILLKLSEREGAGKELKLVPEDSINGLDKERFKVVEDRDHSDYVFLVEHLANMHCWYGHRSSKNIEKFLQQHPDYLVRVSSLDGIPHDKYTEIHNKWASSKGIDNHFKSSEYKAFQRSFYAKKENVEVVSLHKRDELIGFTVYEILSENYAVAHFSKADKNHHSAIYDVLNWEEAKSLGKKGIKHYNWEQDLGISGLRHSKMKYGPHSFLKKFSVSRKD